MNDEQVKKIDKAGGFAFPGELPLPSGGRYFSAGMTLRDWLAGQALTGLIASSPDMGYAQAARQAYGHADALLKERNPE